MLRIENTILHKTLDPKHDTPYRGNQLSVALVMRDIPNLLQPRQEMLNQFIHRFWTACKCQNTCYARVPFNEALSSYEAYLDLDDDIRCVQVGALIQNSVTKPLDNRNTGVRKTYSYRVADVKVCKDFFQFVFQVSRSQINQLQTCIKEEGSFEKKKKGNNFLGKDK